MGEQRDNEEALDANASAVVRMLRENSVASGPRARDPEQAGVLFARARAARARAVVARRRNLALVAVGCGALLLGAVGLLRTRPAGSGDRATLASGTSPLTFTLEDGPPVTGGYVEPAPEGGPRTLSFSDGTRIQIAPRSRARVVETRPEGSRISLEEGRAHVAVVHRPGARWIFEAGPFLINVRGTAFSLGWSGRDASFEIQMESGVVSVTGPVAGGEMILKAGQKLAIDLHALRDQAPAPGGPATEAAPPTAVGAPLDPAGGRGGRAAGAAWAPERWAERLARGRAAVIVGEARRLGLAAALDRITSGQLATLATAARYQHDDELARRALLAQRQRFPGSTRAREASFLLGRLDDESRGDMGAALEWYDRYLAESPEGDYTAEALGRKMMALQRSNRQAQAAKIATDYLRRFPSGTYAHAARALVRAP